MEGAEGERGVKFGFLGAAKMCTDAMLTAEP